MGIKASFDTNNRIIEITEAPVISPGAIVGQTTIDIEIDLYSDAKEDWKNNVVPRGNVFPFITAESAGDALPGGQVEPAFFRLRNDEGWRILPYDDDHELTLLGNIVPVDPTLPIFAPRATRTILIFRDGSQVAQMTTNTVIDAVSQVPEILDIHGQVARSVYIDTELATNGNGYQQTPFNNFTDAVDYAEANGLKNLVILADADIDRQLKNFVITGVGTPRIDTGIHNLDKSEFNRCTLTGLYTGRIVAQECNLTGTFNLNGFFENCAYGSNFIVPDGGIALVKDCSAFVIGQDIPTFDIGGISGTGVLIVTGWNGGFKLINVNQVTDDVKLVMNVSRAVLDASCTGGQINVGGVTRLVNNSAGSTIVSEVLDPNYLFNAYTRLGLEKGNPWTDTPAQSRDANGSIILDNTGDGETTSTGTRQ